MRRSALEATLAAVALAGGCTSGPARPAELDTRNDQCGWCRMTVSDAHLAAQLAAPGEEPLFFDDIGCLRDWLRDHAARPEGAVAFVADHRSGEWVRAAGAVFTEQETLATPMASHLMAHSDAASREADPAAEGGRPVAVGEIFGPGGPPDGRP